VTKPLIGCVCTQIKMASRTVGRRYDEALKGSSVNVVQYSILINTRRYEPIAQMELADHLDMERTTLYRAIDVLEKRGLVVSEATGEGVAKSVRLTAKGRKVTADAETRWREVHDGFVAVFGTEKLDSLNQMLATVREHFR